MKTVRVQVEGNVITDKILNGFALITKGQGYEDFSAQYNGIGAGHDGILTVRTYNGTWAKRTNGVWVDLTPTRTFTVGNDTVNEYVGFDNLSVAADRGYLFSRSTTRVEFTTDGTYIFPWFNLSDNTIIVHTKITPGNWLKTTCGWFYAGRQLFSEPVSIGEWADMISVTNPPATDDTTNKQIRLPENIYGNMVDFGVALAKILSARDEINIYVYGYPNINGTIAEAFNYVAERVSAGKKALLYFPYVHTDEELNNKQVTFDGEGGYSVPETTE